MKLKKSLGQHFLINEEICSKIVDYTLSQKPSNLLEIGPGGGALTKYFIKKSIIDNFIAFEVDNEKISYLKYKYPVLESKIHHQDILKATLPFKQKFSVVGNFPYNISSQILFKIMEWQEHIEFMVGMFQKELAQRVVANPNSKDYGILSVLIQTFFETKIIFDISPNNFNPPPKVNSSILFLKPLQNIPQISNYQLFASIIKTSFQQRRKQLKNTLNVFFSKEYLNINPLFQKRPENLTKDDFYFLYQQIINEHEEL